MNEKILASIFYYYMLPLLNKYKTDRTIFRCPMCDELLEFYDKQGWLHLEDGDADCWGCLSIGKGDAKGIEYNEDT